MIHYPRVLLLLFLAYSSFTSAQFVRQDLWQCTTEDSSKKQWSAQNSFQKLAYNRALDLCKKESSQPTSCKAEAVHCNHLVNGSGNKSSWRCTALDRNAEAWRGKAHPSSEDAALAAKGFCRRKSLVPDTCYVNMVTCVNRGEWR